jgi:hypothetical protein
MTNIAIKSVCSNWGEIALIKPLGFDGFKMGKN